jgi:hypothetical protein
VTSHGSGSLATASETAAAVDLDLRVFLTPNRQQAQAPTGAGVAASYIHGHADRNPQYVAVGQYVIVRLEFAATAIASSSHCVVMRAVPGSQAWLFRNRRGSASLQEYVRLTSNRQSAPMVAAYRSANWHGERYISATHARGNARPWPAQRV